VVLKAWERLEEFGKCGLVIYEFMRLSQELRRSPRFSFRGNKLIIIDLHEVQISGSIVFHDCLHLSYVLPLAIIYCG
jgi:hypothetical protein